MTTAQINISAAVRFEAGEHLNGATLAAPEWVLSGPATVSLERAEALERNGYADIISKDGKPYTWASCCSGDHDHA